MNELVTTLWLSQQAAVPLPSTDPLGLPVPLWILQSLSYLTLTLHFLAMNFTVGGAILLLLARRQRGKPGREGIARFWGASLPLGVSYLVTLGIPPLLFVQVIYGQLFYSSSVLLGAFWIMVIPLVITGYAIFYYHKFTHDTRPNYQTALLAVGLGALLVVGFIYVNNLTLSMTPARWLSFYRASPSGALLNLGEPTLFPRYFLFLVPSLIVAGMALILRGAYLARWGLEEEGHQSKVFGFYSFLIGMALEGLAGVGVVATLPRNIVKEIFAGERVTILLGIGVVLAVLATVSALAAVGKRGLFFPFVGSFATAGALGSFVVLRDQIRLSYLQPYFSPSNMPIHAQWGIFFLFVLSLVVGLVVLIVLLSKVTPLFVQSSIKQHNQLQSPQELPSPQDKPELPSPQNTPEIPAPKDTQEDSLPETPIPPSKSKSDPS